MHLFLPCIISRSSEAKLLLTATHCLLYFTIVNSVDPTNLLLVHTAKAVQLQRDEYHSSPADCIH